ncbi:MAG: multidrug efflux SMR transporter [Rhodospirillaceae bacterium]|nr:multidrug efflux SMR transporter [Rhodospirillaceae bacterium]MBT5297110.1 multidrug efflux SMR transporter [Rhodospirillaceae bacterium]MBT5512882.1 multidrug efflux SMR transporter [Rhodospirillaceae bacterium]MBT6086433.1 multidrug efflux SMR transporter [Rhodospirillaceae bacterium]MBT6884323.1 multidrug efflux SMR transporter [Rhodospirillaceae bacterium]
MPWFLLALAIVAEVIGTVALKFSLGFTVFMPSLIVAAGYGVSIWFLALALKVINLGTAYAIWAGAGTALVALTGVILFKEPMTILKAACVGFIILGVFGLHFAEAKTG